MATTALTASQTNAPGQGPRTESGKDQSSRNALTFGLFTARDFVRPQEREEYAGHCDALRAELNPAGPLEEVFADAIIGAAWRLRRCLAVEARIAAGDPDLDPMEAGEAAQRLQLSVDRARSQAHNLLRRSLAELRRLQTQREIRTTIFEETDDPPAPDLTSYHEVSIALDRLESARTRLRKQAETDALAAAKGPVPGAAPDLASFCNEAPSTSKSPRTAERRSEHVLQSELNDARIHTR
jgi:hypothetical protein